jgi:phage gpG-like protein
MLNVRMEGYNELVFDIDRILSQAPVSIREIVKRGAILIEAKVKDNLTNKILNVRTGHLRRSIVTIFYGGGTSAEIGTNLKYAAIHEFGGVIHAKNGPFLWFKMQTGSRFMSKSGNILKRPQGIFQWIKTPSVTIPARPYMQPAFNEALPIIDKMIDEEIERFIE